MPDQPPPNSTRTPILGFAAGTPLLTPEGNKPIEDVKPGDFIQTGPDEEQLDDRHEDPEQAKKGTRSGKKSEEKGTQLISRRKGDAAHF